MPGAGMVIRPYTWLPSMEPHHNLAENFVFTASPMKYSANIRTCLLGSVPEVVSVTRAILVVLVRLATTREQTAVQRDAKPLACGFFEVMSLSHFSQDCLTSFPCDSMNSIGAMVDFLRRRIIERRHALACGPNAGGAGAPRTNPGTASRSLGGRTTLTLV